MNEYTVYTLDEYDDVTVEANYFEIKDNIVYFYKGLTKEVVAIFRFDKILGVVKESDS